MLLYGVLPVAAQAIMYILAVVGVAMVSGSALALILAPRTEECAGNYSPIPVIPIASQYFKPEIRICK